MDPLPADLLPAQPGEPLYRRAARSLRAAILAGRLPEGARLPSSRTLSARWGLARNTVLEATELLAEEGFLVKRPQSGIYVAGGLKEPRAPEAPQWPLSAWARRAMTGALEEAGGGFEIDFRLGIVPAELFPSEAWAEALSRRAREARSMGYGGELGPHQTRVALADHLAAERGVVASPDTIMLTSGTQGSLDALSRLYLEPGRTVAFEDPFYPAARRVFEASGARLCPVPVDDEGLDPAGLPASAALLYLTPTAQFPTGAVLPARRRVQVLDWAARSGALIVEDDYTSEFRWDARPPSALQGLAPERVALTGTFSKSLAPALRSGFLVAPPAVIQALARTRPLTDRQPPTLDALALADFLASGGYVRHLRRARVQLAARLEVLHAALRRHLPAWQPQTRAASLHLCVRLPPALEEAEVQARAARAGVGLSVLGSHSLRPQPPTVLLGYAHLSAAQIEEGVRRIAGALAGVGRGE